MRELRCLVFTENELVTAIIDRRRKVREPLPVGTVSEVTFETTGMITGTMHIVDDDGTARQIRLSEAELAAALVNYCMNRKIPMPAESDKFIEIIKGSAALMITMNFNKPARILTQKPPDNRRRRPSPSRP